MIRFARTTLAASLLAVAFSAGAQDGDITVREPWVRGTVAAQKATGAFMQISSKSGAALVSASSPVAGVVEIHNMVVDGGVMKMRAVPKIDLPAGKSVELKPGSYHVMLMDLKQPLKEGETVPLTLTFEQQDKRQAIVEIKAPVKALTQPAH